MNYDQIAAMKVDELRKTFRELRVAYNVMMDSRISAKEIKHAPKARLLFFVIRYWIELDVRTKYKRMFEELQHREEVISQSVEDLNRREHELMQHYRKSSAEQQAKNSMVMLNQPKRTFLVTMEELINDTQKYYR